MGLNYRFGSLTKGEKNNICDVDGIRIGHRTLDEGQIQTGVTVLIPAPGSLFRSKLEAGVSVLNGFGKSAGLVQVEELGSLESPIVLTNTLSVGTCLNGLTRYMLEENPEIGDTTGTVNSLVMECNDGTINDIRGLHVSEEDVFMALETAKDNFEEGSIGAGRGMICFGLKGGIGSSSRLVELDRTYKLGALVLSNFGQSGRLVIDGKKIPAPAPYKEDQGSIIIIIATDIPMKSRQLKRLAKRAGMALGRTGSIMGNGSGDIALAFSTASRISHEAKDFFQENSYLHEEHINKVFEAAVDAVEEAIISSMYHSEAMTSRRGEKIPSLREFWHD